MKLPFAILISLAFCVSAPSQTIFTDFPSGSLDSWAVSGNTIELVGVHSWTETPNNYRWVYFGVDGMNGTTPEFQIGSFDSSFLGDLAEHRFVWSYDQRSWSFFDNNIGTSAEFQFSNDQPFIQNEVYVAYSTPYPVTRTTEHVEAMSSKWFVTPTNSSNDDLLIRSVEGTKTAELPLYGFRITNPLIQETKTKVVLVGGNHSGEPGGSFALEGMLDFLVSDDARARQMRNVADFYVYPQVDPRGRDEGFFRGNSLNAASDHNRFWDANTSGDNGGFEEVDILIAAMKQDTGSNVDYAFDFHGFFDSGPNFIFTDTAGSETEFYKELKSLQPSLAVEVDDSTLPAGIFEFWAKTPGGLNADFAFTPEFSPNASAENSKAWGESYALAMFAELGSPQFVRSTEEVDTLTRALSAGDEDLNLDLNRNGKLDEDDLAFLLEEIIGTVPGDTDLNGRVDFPDFLALSDSFGQSGGWGDGDFDGNQRIEFADFLLLSQNFGTSAAVTIVPEPNLEWLGWQCGLLAFAIRRRRR